jgi:hypothetical protein
MTGDFSTMMPIRGTVEHGEVPSISSNLNSELRCFRAKCSFSLILPNQVAKSKRVVVTPYYRNNMRQVPMIKSSLESRSEGFEMTFLAFANTDRCPVLFFGRNIEIIVQDTTGRSESGILDGTLGTVNCRS